jgi:hypothetical protein
MEDNRSIASRVVTPTMHEAFAVFSGDRNPMHMDAKAARRTPAGLPVVHGVHTLLWALDALACSGRLVSPLARVRVKFVKWVYLGDEAVVRSPTHGSADPAQLLIEIHGLSVCSIDLTYGKSAAAPADYSGAPSPLTPISYACDLSFDDLAGRAGIAFTARPSEAERMFPNLTAMIGAVSVADIAACSYVVGMEAPGLHSMFSKLDVTLVQRQQEPTQAELRSGLQYQVEYTDERFSKVRVACGGAGIFGSFEAFMRDPPVQQPRMESIVSHVSPQEFSGMRALIIGGSRGLGELTAKLIAAGGGEPIITYVLGEADAKCIVQDIRNAGALASAMEYDVRKDPAVQLAVQHEPVTHLFYFATGTIFKPKPGVYANSMLIDFMQFYVRGFYDLCSGLLEKMSREGHGHRKLLAFYPSTVFIEARPAGMTEYAMAKAAGEQLCVDMNTYMSGIHILAPRLPKLYTDQTAGVLPEGQVDTVGVLLPLIRELASKWQV